MSESSSTRSNIALSKKAEAAMEEVKRRLPFSEARDAARFAFSVAVADGLSPTDRSEFGPMTGMNWNVNSLDPDGELSELIRLLWPDEEDPYRVLETLMNAGMVVLAKKLSEDPSLKASDLLTEGAA